MYSSASGRRGLADEQALKPRPRGAQPDIARARQVVNAGNFLLMSAIMWRQEENGPCGIPFDAQNLRVKESAPGFVISGRQHEGALWQDQPGTIVEDQFTLVVARQFAKRARRNPLGLAAEKH